MKVNKAKNIFSNDVSSSFELLADELNKPEFITTAWFVKMISEWFCLITSRSCNLAFGKKNDIVKILIFLKEVIYIFTNLEIDNKFKPVQKGIIISTTSIIELTEYLITEREM